MSARMNRAQETADADIRRCVLLANVHGFHVTEADDKSKSFTRETADFRDCLQIDTAPEFHNAHRGLPASPGFPCLLRVFNKRGQVLAAFECRDLPEALLIADRYSEDEGRPS